MGFGPAAGGEALGDLGDLAGVVQEEGAAVEVGAEADVVDAGDVDGVFDVVEVALEGGVGPVDEVMHAADADDAAAIGDGLHLVVVQVASVAR